MGTTVEFQPRGTFTPLTDMVGGGPFHLAAGQWTDDTSMALCLATSLVEQGGFDAADQMRRYCDWLDHGYLSSTGSCFDVGATVRRALQRFKRTGEPFSGDTDPKAAGNGCIMRLAPVPMYYFPDEADVVHYAAESSRTTHAAQECLDACRLLGVVLLRALSGLDKETVLFAATPAEVVSDSIRSIGEGGYRANPESAIRGSGYVVRSLEAALWCFWTTDNFEAAILKAANLGDDADTTAAICGQVAGAFYGETGIPRHWLERLAQGEFIRGLADQLYQAAQARPALGARATGHRKATE